MNALELNWMHLASTGFTWIYLGSLGPTWIHLDFLGLTRIHQNSLELTGSHMGSLEPTKTNENYPPEPKREKRKGMGGLLFSQFRPHYQTVRACDRTETISRLLSLPQPPTILVIFLFKLGPAEATSFVGKMRMDAIGWRYC